MIYFFLGLILLGVSLFLLNGFMKGDPAKMAGPIKRIGGLICLVLAVFLTLRGLYVVSIPIGLFGLGMLLGKRRYFTGGGRARSSYGAMTEAEALRILGLEVGATKAQILKAHKEKMKDNHPDRGGSEEEAKKINRAKDFLIERFK